MVRGGFRHLIVMGDGMDEAVGILSIRDLVEALLDEREEMAARAERRLQRSRRCRAAHSKG